jgi:hypothetical protein
MGTCGCSGFFSSLVSDDGPFLLCNLELSEYTEAESAQQSHDNGYL